MNEKDNKDELSPGELEQASGGAIPGASKLTNALAKGSGEKLILPYVEQDN